MSKYDKKVLISIKMTIFSIFSAALIILMGVVIGVTYYRNTKAAVATADRLMETASQQVFMKIENLYEPLLFITDQAVDLPILGEKPSLQKHPAEQYLMKTMEAYPQIQILYIGYSDGDFYEILSFEGRFREQLQQSVGAPEDAQYGILRQFTTAAYDEPVRLWKFLNKAYQTIGSRKQKSTGYDPRKRPWYTNAIKSEGSVKTDPYLFSNIKKMGLTISRKIDGTVSGVLGADILLDEICWFLEDVGRDYSSLILTFNKDMEITAFPTSLEFDRNLVKPGLSDLNNPEVIAFMEYLSAKELQEEMDFTLKTTAEQFLIKVKKLPAKYSNNEYLFIAIPRDVILGPVEKTAAETAFISLLIMIAAFPIILVISRKISSPLKKLVFEAGEIGQFNLSGDIEVESRITEIHKLAVEMISMKKGIRSFNRYVPSKLVKRLIESGEEESIGGVTREVTILFSDIEEFTNIAESMPAEKLMKRLSGYFEVLSKEVSKTDGTVDKFIGDALMAFWNAPVDDPNHAIHACEAAINIQKRINEMKGRWTDGGHPVFNTRIGINSGLAVIGNVGSIDRMNYTAIGDIVNSSSRLESINKLYGTRILIGEPVVEKLNSDFIYRPLENVVVKGKSEPQGVYELIGFTSDKLSAQQDFAMLFTEGFNLYSKKAWPEALAFFDKAYKINEADPTLIKYRNLCREYITSPPGNDWTGIRILRRK